jgi:hypothetical protein
MTVQAAIENTEKRKEPRSPFNSERISRETAFFSLYTGTILILVVILLSAPKPIPTSDEGAMPIVVPKIHSASFEVKQNGGLEALAQFLSSHDRHARCFVFKQGSLRTAMKATFEYTKKFESLISLNVSPREALAKFVAVPMPKSVPALQEEVLCQIED